MASLTPGPSSRVDDDPDRDGRRETANERADRNWNELLQELRVLQTGTQIITGFLLALAFQPAFADLAAGQRTFYLVLVVLAALSAIIALAPVALHRMVFQKGIKPTVVIYGHAALITALVTVSLLLIGVVSFIFEVVLGDPAAWVSGAVLGMVIAIMWFLAPRMLRHRRDPEDDG